MDKNPSLFQVNTRVWLKELSTQLKRPATLDDIPDSFFDELVEKGFAWLYLLSIWKTGEAGRKVSRTNFAWLNDYRAVLPDCKEEDICGSGFAITEYAIDPTLGKPESLARLRTKLHERGMKLMLDFVPNHTAIDHPWVVSHPDYYVQGTEELYVSAPQNYIKLGEGEKKRIFAYGRDPYFDGWPDTLQLNYGNPDLGKAMLGELNNIASVCDGVRCDMAMLITPDVFRRTWNVDFEPFWPNAITNLRQKHPEFIFMAEVYWDMEWELQQQGFDYTYDKKLYDRLRQGDAREVLEHFWADFSYQKCSARFLENHDEPRAGATFLPKQHKAAAMIAFFCPGLHFFHQGQFEGFKNKLSVHLSRRSREDIDSEVKTFYDDLLKCLKLQVVHNGQWSLVECAPAWAGNYTWDRFIAFSWRASDEQFIVIVNYADHQSQCYAKIPIIISHGSQIDFHDLIQQKVYERDLQYVAHRGLYVDLPAWGFHTLLVQKVESRMAASVRAE